MVKKVAEPLVTKTPEEIPEVQTYLEELKMFEEFKKLHSHLFETYDYLLDTMNQRLVEADKAVRAQQVSCGPWHLQRIQIKYDPEKLRELVGEKRFFDLGGTKQTKITYEIGKSMIETAIARKELEDDLIEEIKCQTPYYEDAPKPRKA